MADNVQLSTNVGTGEVCATDDVGGVQYQRVKLTDGTADSTTVIAAGGGVEASALRVTIASDSTGLLSIDDNGGSLTVDGTVAATQSGSWTVDLGATDNAVLDAIAASLAGTLTIAGAVTNAGTFAVQAAQTGTWTVDLGATDNAVLDAIAASLAGTLTVAGAVTNAGTFAVQAAQSGTWTVQPGNTANTTAWLVTGTGGTFPVSGVAAHGAAVSGNPVLLAGENPLGNVARLQTATDGDLIVHQHSDSVSLADNISNTVQVTINEDDAGILYTPTVGYMFDGTSWDRVRGTSADGLLVNLGSNNDVTITSGTITTVSAVTAITNALPAGTNAIGKLAANSGVDIGDVDVLSIAAGSNLIGDVSLQPRTTGGLTMSKTTSAASTNATSLKASAGQVYSIQCFNVNAAVRYLKLYNKASAPTVGTDTPVKTLAIPGNTAGAGFVISWPQGIAFGTGIAFALTTEATDAGTTGVAANEITVNIDYK